MASVGVIGVQIPANQAISGEADLGAATAIAFEMPEGWSGTTITFQSKATRNLNTTQGQASEDWDNVYDDTGTELSVVVGANQVVGLKADKAAVLAGCRFLRIRSGTSAAPFNQNPTREIKILTKGA